MSADGAGCKCCGSKLIEKDSLTREYTCASCGTVRETEVVAVHSYDTKTDGQFVSDDRYEYLLNRMDKLPSKLNRNTALVSSKDKNLTRCYVQMKKLARLLKIDSNCERQAFELYKTLRENGLSRGRRLDSVYGTCFYIICCRRERTGHVLNDFTTGLQLKSSDIRRTYGHIVRNDNAIDFHFDYYGREAAEGRGKREVDKQDADNVLLRYAHEIGFDSWTYKVYNTAVRIRNVIGDDDEFASSRYTYGALYTLACQFLNYHYAHEIYLSSKGVIKFFDLKDRSLTRRRSEIRSKCREYFKSFIKKQTVDPSSDDADDKKFLLELAEFLKYTEKRYNAKYTSSSSSSSRSKVSISEETSSCNEGTSNARGIRNSSNSKESNDNDTLIDLEKKLSASNGIIFNFDNDDVDYHFLRTDKDLFELLSYRVSEYIENPNYYRRIFRSNDNNNVDDDGVYNSGRGTGRKCKRPEQTDTKDNDNDNAKMIEKKKKLSNKINYEVLNNLDNCPITDCTIDNDDPWPTSSTIDEYFSNNDDDEEENDSDSQDDSCQTISQLLCKRALENA